MKKETIKAKEVSADEMAEIVNDINDNQAGYFKEWLDAQQDYSLAAHIERSNHIAVLHIEQILGSSEVTATVNQCFKGVLKPRVKFSFMRPFGMVEWFKAEEECVVWSSGDKFSPNGGGYDRMPIINYGGEKYLGSYLPVPPDKFWPAELNARVIRELPHVPTLVKWEVFVKYLEERIGK